MEEWKKSDQIDILLPSSFSFANGPLLYEDIPEYLKKSNDVVKIADYNNQYKGIITNDFFAWALENNISYEVICWFIKDFSDQNEEEIIWLIDALFNPYTIYLDESSNCVKFRFKDPEGNTNVKWYNDFVLSGVAYEGNTDPISIDELFDRFKLQKNITDVKLRHIANYNGEDGNRFVEILKSSKVSILLETLLQADRVYIHWDTENLLYFSLVDIVDSALEVPLIHDEVKNVLYNNVVRNKNELLSILAQYGYPNIDKSKVSDFCEAFIYWIESLEAQSFEEDFALELLRQGMKSSRRANNLLFLHNNTDRLLINNFVPMYAQRAATFPNSSIHFDKCGIVEENIQSYVQSLASHKYPYYDFLDSADNKWIQLSDMISGINGALMAYVNTHDISIIRNDLMRFDEIQNKNLTLLMLLRQKSYKKNKYFDRMSKNVQQLERLIFLRDYCILE